MSKNKHMKSPLQVSPQSVPTISKSARTRAAILNAALEFLWSHPFREMTIASLMAETDVGRSAFYQHFKDLEEVMEYLLEMVQTEIFDAANGWITCEDNPAAALSDAMRD